MLCLLDQQVGSTRRVISIRSSSSTWSPQKNILSHLARSNRIWCGSCGIQELVALRAPPHRRAATLRKSADIRHLNERGWGVLPPPDCWMCFISRRLKKKARPQQICGGSGSVRHQNREQQMSKKRKSPDEQEPLVAGGSAQGRTRGWSTRACKCITQVQRSTKQTATLSATLCSKRHVRLHGYQEVKQWWWCLSEWGEMYKISF